VTERIFRIAMVSSRLALAALVVTGACVSTPTARPPVRATPVAVAPVAGANLSGPWGVPYVTSVQRVSIGTQAVIVISGDPATRTDTLGSTLEATYARSPGDHRRVDGSLLAYQLAPGSGAPMSVPGLSVPVRFSVDARQGTPEFRLPLESTACSEPALSVLQALHDAWMPLPDTIRPGMEWSDTVHTLSCRDRLPLRGTVVRRFKVAKGESDNGRVMVVIDRRIRSTLSGEGEQFGEHVTVEGAGDGTMQYVLDAAAGRLVRGDGTSRLELSFKSKRRNQKVRQDATLALRWKP
jgi:hypothetical protein